MPHWEERRDQPAIGSLGLVNGLSKVQDGSLLGSWTCLSLMCDCTVRAHSGWWGQGRCPRHCSKSGGVTGTTVVVLCGFARGRGMGASAVADQASVLDAVVAMLLDMLC
jgi:hypothetical protein